MTTTIKFHLRNWQLIRQMEKLAKKHDEEISAARKRKATNDETDYINYEFFRDNDFLEQEQMLLHHDRIVKIARQRLIPIPRYTQESPDWVRSIIFGRHHLSVEALKTLRDQIHSDRKQKLETWQPWLVLAMGLAGTLIGLISVMNRPAFPGGFKS